jgi:hypothetical protein
MDVSSGLSFKKLQEKIIRPGGGGGGGGDQLNLKLPKLLVNICSCAGDQTKFTKQGYTPTVDL